jgi:hypothetical protein
MSEDNIISLRPDTLSREGWGQREHEALTLARLSRMPELDYDRARTAAARALKCRVSWLDRKIQELRIEIAKFEHFPPSDDGVRPGTAINFIHNDGSDVLGFVIATANRYGKNRHLLVLADGNGTVVDSIPLTKDRIAELHQRKLAREEST